MLTNSWIVVDRASGRAVLETFSRHVAKSINLTRYEVLSAYDYLVRFNAKLKESQENDR